MRVSSFTQTYGSDRMLELLLLQHDAIGNHFRNKCDVIVFSFHNCPDDFIAKGRRILAALYSPHKLVILEYNRISYTETIRHTLEKLKTMNVDYVLQIQDDQHGINGKEQLEHLDEIDKLFTWY